MNLTTSSPINVEKLSRQNKMIYDHLMRGETITTLQAERLYGIRNLHSRIPELKSAGVIIYDQTITVIDRFGKKVICKEYSLKEF